MATPAPQVAAQPSPTSVLETACQNLMQLRQRPLLILYYPNRSRVTENDLGDVYSALRSSTATVESKLPALDVLIDSNGGDPVAAYRLAQLIRDFSSRVSFLVADHAYSAATLLCFAGDEIRLAHYAGLSPIDITLVSDRGGKPREEVELVNVDSFMDFAKKARQIIEEELRRIGSDRTTDVDSKLLVAMVEEVGALRVGKFFRERTLTGHYAEELLDRYMFASLPDRIERRKELIQNLIFGAPAHDYHLDFHLCSKWNMIVAEMPTNESDLAKAVTSGLDDLALSNAICSRLSRNSRYPFFGFYPYAAQAAVGGSP